MILEDQNIPTDNVRLDYLWPPSWKGLIIQKSKQEFITIVSLRRWAEKYDNISVHTYSVIENLRPFLGGTNSAAILFCSIP